MSDAMTMAHTGAQMLVTGKAKPEQITPDGVHAFAVAVVELEGQRDQLLEALKVYLQAGHKEARRKASVLAKKAIERAEGRS